MAGMSTEALSEKLAAARYVTGLSATLKVMRIWSEEFERSLRAAHRYEKLRVGRSANSISGENGNKAREVFIELYAGK